MGPLVALIALTLSILQFWPQIRIDPGPNPDPAQLGGAEFIISNIGRVSVYNATFKCSIGTPVVWLGGALMGGSIAPAAVIPPGRPVTRSCFVGDVDIAYPNVTISVNYKWPIIPKLSTEIGYFVVKSATSGAFFFVPDLPR